MGEYKNLEDIIKKCNKGSDYVTWSSMTKPFNQAKRAGLFQRKRERSFI